MDVLGKGRTVARLQSGATINHKNLSIKVLDTGASYIISACPYATESAKNHRESCLLQSYFLLRRERLGFYQSLVDPGNGRVNGFQNAILFALNIASVSLHPSPGTSFSVYRSARNDEVREPQPGHLSRNIFRLWTIRAPRLERSLLDDLRCRFDVERALSD